MNNSKFAIEQNSLSSTEAPDNKPLLREKENELIHIIDCLQRIQKTEEWSSLKIKVFDPLTSSLSKQIHTEAVSPIPDTLKLNRLAGELKWAQRYSDLSKFENTKRIELTNIRKLLYGTKE